MKTRKIHALLLALCMLISILPAVPAAQAAAGDTTTISFLGATETAVALNTVKIADGSDWELSTDTKYTHSTTVSTSNITNYSWTRSYEAVLWLGTNDVQSAKAGINFVVEKAGWYDLTLNILATRGGAATTAVAVNDKELNSVTWPGIDPADRKKPETVAESLGNVFLKKGVNVIAFTKIDGPNVRETGSTIYLHSLELTESTNTISFLSKTGETHELSQFSLSEDKWEISQNHTSSDAYQYISVTNYSEANTTCANIWMGNGGKVGIKFNAEKAGWYDVALNIVDAAGRAMDVAATINGEAVGTIKWDGTVEGSCESKKLGTRYLKEGENILVLQRNNTIGDRLATNTLYLHSLTFSESDSAPTNFGDTYAYVQEINDGRDTKYKLSLIGGIDGLGYESVGFKVIVGGVEVADMPITNVYESIKLSNNDSKSAELTAANFFDDAENCYIFCDSREYSSTDADKKVEFRAYATKDGVTTYGPWAEISTLAKAQ